MTYSDKSTDERLMLDQVYQLIFNNKYDMKYYHTPIEGIDVYDSHIVMFNKGDYVATHNIIIEAKVRDIAYSTILLERKKLKSLKKEIERFKIYNTKLGLLYISCDPSGTYIFDLLKLEKDMVWVKEMHNKSTIDKSMGKVMKEITYLDIKLAKKVNFTQKDLEKSKRDKETLSKSKDKQLDDNRNRCIFKGFDI
jgi:hypothetical protein